MTRVLVSTARGAGKVPFGKLSKDSDWPKLTQAAEDLYRALFVDDTPGINITQLRSKLAA